MFSGTAWVCTSFYPVQRNYHAQLLMATHSNADEATFLWHRRLGHVNAADLAKLPAHATGIQLGRTVELPFCDACAIAKSAHTPTKKKATYPATTKFERVFSDTIGPLPPSWPYNYRYALNYIDEHTGYAMIYCLKKRSDTPSTLEQKRTINLHEVH